MDERKSIPVPAAARLCAVYRLLCDLSAQGVNFVSSGDLGEALGIGAHNIRKDISHISGGGSGRSGYDTARLKKQIAEHFGLENEYRACVTGLGRLGQALVRDGQHIFKELKIVAAFDSDLNRVETIDVGVPVHPTYEITETVKRLNIDTAILTVPDPTAQECAERLITGGIKGIMNFTATHLKVKGGVTVRNIDLAGEFKILSALMFLGG
ncbi:MAG: redox-sensing transcriptional repressor Rex [Chitinispirillales bacterium]|jgi:redox-sensing transcriptional repressor|nr:redox-sensing transcriptional repressor Rex [Chitinispirillales bacterium]